MYWVYYIIIAFKIYEFLRALRIDGKIRKYTTRIDVSDHEANNRILTWLNRSVRGCCSSEQCHVNNVVVTNSADVVGIHHPGGIVVPSQQGIVVGVMNQLSYCFNYWNYRFISNILAFMMIRYCDPCLRSYFTLKKPMSVGYYKTALHLTTVNIVWINKHYWTWANLYKIYI